MKYRKKPVVIEAIQWDGNNLKDLQNWAKNPDGVPLLHEEKDFNLAVFTLEGVMIANSGDYIIKGIKGEFYPCKPDIFEMTYEPVAE